MSSFVIVSDSGGDFTPELLQETGIPVLPLSFHIDGKTYLDYPDHADMDPKLFFGILRSGGTASTSAVNVQQYVDRITPILEQGSDVLILSFSSTLSATCHSATIAAEELADKYPNRKIYSVDTRCASLGLGLFALLASQEQKKGKTIDEVRDWALANCGKICHWFTVDDLNHLKRGGRISSGSAFLGTLLSIKPILHMDREGRLVNVGKARGRNATLQTLLSEMEKSVLDPVNSPVFISHGDALEEAQKLADMIRERFGTKRIEIGPIGAVIGAHAGPGTLALFFVGNQR